MITALAAFTVNLSVENISGFKFWATLTIMERGNLVGSFLAYVAMNAALVTASVAITIYVGPAAAGSGIPEVKVRMFRYAAVPDATAEGTIIVGTGRVFESEFRRAVREAS